MQLSLPTNQLTLADLERACRRETRRYWRAEPSDSRFCLEIFQRALQLQAQASGAPTRSDGVRPVYVDEEARGVLIGIYTDFIKAQINRAAVDSAAIDDLVQQVWLRFWQAANHGLSFPSLEAALNYLKQTTVSALLEERRRGYKRRRDESLQQVVEVQGPDALADLSSDVFADHARRRFRTRCCEILTDPLEYRVFWMRYGMGLPPRDIARELAGAAVPINNRAATARNVSDLLDRSCRRLRLDPEIQALLASD